VTAPVFIWGLVAIASGIGIGVYGTVLFKFALAAIGFSVGFVATLALLDGQGEWVRLLIAVVVGGLAGALLYSLFRFALYIAGAILGVVLAIVIGSIVEQFFAGLADVIWIIIALVGIGLGGVFGPRLGNFVIILATSVAGAYLIAEGFDVWFASNIGSDPSDLASTLTHRMTMVIFLVIVIIFILSQRMSTDLRQRLIR
jgi:hypothetical protein